MGTSGAPDSTVLSRDDLYQERGLIYRPKKAFDHGLPDVPVHAFYDELDRVLDPAAPTMSVLLDLADELHLPYPATTPLLLGRYAVVRAGESLSHRFHSSVDVHYVLRGNGFSVAGPDRISWSAGDCVTFPGGQDTTHVAETDALIFTITNEPELAYTHTAPAEGSPVVAAAFRSAAIDAELDLVHGATGPQVTAGKSVSFTTEAMHGQISGAISPTMMVAVNTLEPGGIQRRHRHNSSAITVPVSCEGTYSLIGATKVEWRQFGVIVTPPRLAHSHINGGTGMMSALVVQDGPVFYNARSIGFEWTDEVL